jgi:hypothetical protein
MRIKKMPNLLRGFGMIIFFSENFKRQALQLSSAWHLSRFRYCIVGLWLHTRQRANAVLLSQQSFKKSNTFFRHRPAFVLDLPIGLMKFACNFTALGGAMHCLISFGWCMFRQAVQRTGIVTFTLTMNRIEHYYPSRRSRWWLFISSLLFTLLICLGFLFLPAQAQGQNGFVQPIPGDVLSGIVIVQGTATDPSFLRYELAFLNESGPGGDWIVFAQGDQPVIDGTLAVWDTTVGSGSNRVFPDGRYQLRLRVVRQDFNYDEYFVTNLTIANDTVTPSPTATLTTTDPVETVPPPAAETPLPVQTQPVPGVLPSLTPFPTPSPQATPVNEPLGPGSDGGSADTEEGRGVLDQIAGIDTGQFEAAFWQGVRFVALAFGLLVAYLLLRGVFRRLWRLLLNRLLR